MNGAGLIDVFPISSSAFGLPPGWFDSVAPQFVHTAYLLMTLLLVVSIGIMVLKQFEEVQLEKKLWNIPVTIVAIFFWPGLVIELKTLIDAFDTFLIRDIFKIPWNGFGFPHPHSAMGALAWPGESLALLLPNLAYWIVYAFYIIFIFFHVVLGPLILAKGVLFNEIEAFLELLKEILNLFMWQTMVVVLVGFIYPDAVSGNPQLQQTNSNVYFLSLILGIMIFFVPSISRKFGNHLGSSFFPNFLRMGGLVLGIKAFEKVGAVGLTSLGVPLEKFQSHFDKWHHRVVFVENAQKRYERIRQINDLEKDNESTEREFELHRAQDRRNLEAANQDPDLQDLPPQSGVFDLLRRAKTEVSRATPEEEKT